jgi:hypothetical protein
VRLTLALGLKVVCYRTSKLFYSNSADPRHGDEWMRWLRAVLFTLAKTVCGTQGKLNLQSTHNRIHLCGEMISLSAAASVANIAPSLG